MANDNTVVMPSPEEGSTGQLYQHSSWSTIFNARMIKSGPEEKVLRRGKNGKRKPKIWHSGNSGNTAFKVMVVNTAKKLSIDLMR